MSLPQVLLVSQDGCNPCRRVRRILEEIRREGGRFGLREVAFDSEEGLDLAVGHGIQFPPAVFLDGRLIARGKVPENVLRLALARPMDSER